MKHLDVLLVHPTEQDIIEFWEAALLRMELGMDKGSSPTWLTYGWTYRDTEFTRSYSLTDKPADRRGGKRDGAGRPTKDQAPPIK